MRTIFRLSLSVPMIFLAHAATASIDAPIPSSASNPVGTFASESLGLNWLSNMTSPQTLQWVANENKKAKDFVSLDSSGQPDALYSAIGARFKELAPNNPAAPIETPAGRVFQKAGGLVLVDALGVESVVAPKITHADGSGYSAVAEFKVSPDESKVLYSYIKNGSDMNAWYVADLATKQTLAGPYLVRLNDANWSSDSAQIYYTDWDNAGDLARGVRLTRNFLVNLNTKTQELAFQPPQVGSREFYAMDDIDFNGTRYLIAHRAQGAAEIPVAVYLGREAKAKSGEFQVGRFAWRTVRLPMKNRLGKYIGSEGSKLFLRSTEAGNGFGIVSVDFAKKMKTETVIPARKGQVLIYAQRIGSKLYLQYFSTKTFAWTLEIADFNGKIETVMRPSDVGLPDIGTVGAYVATKYSKSVYLTYSELRVPPVTLKIDTANPKLQVLPSAGPLPFDSSRIKYELTWVKSTDGTLVPVEVYSRSDIAKPTFAYLFYYGYIGIPQFSWWNKKYQMVMDMGGAVAFVHHRGGGELGRDWQMSVKVDRLKSLEDTVAAGRWLRKNLNVDKIAVSGRSFGGMHTMELLVHHTDEFDAYVPVVSVADVNEFLSKGLFGFYAVDDFGIERDSKGNPLDTPAWRASLAKWSPLANINKMKTIKPTMIFTGDNDERTGPYQSYYMTEALNQKFPSSGKVLMFQEKFNGHNGRTEFQDEASFLAKTFGINSLNTLK